MKMVTILAGKQLQRDMAKKRTSTMDSVREESASELDNNSGEFLLLYNDTVRTFGKLASLQLGPH